LVDDERPSAVEAFRMKYLFNQFETMLLDYGMFRDTLFPNGCVRLLDGRGNILPPRGIPVYLVCVLARPVHLNGSPLTEEDLDMVPEKDYIRNSIGQLYSPALIGTVVGVISFPTVPPLRSLSREIAETQAFDHYNYEEEHRNYFLYRDLLDGHMQECRQQWEQELP
jgi:hypothetical protein